MEGHEDKICISKVWPEVVLPGCLLVATVVSPVAVPHRGGVIALPSHSVKTLKTFLDFDHYQHLSAASRRAPQLAGSAPASRAACHTQISR